MEIIIKQRKMLSRAKQVYVVAYTSTRVLTQVPAYRDSLSGRTVDHVMLPEFERAVPVRVPDSIYDYPRYRQEMLNATRFAKGCVMKRYLKKYPLGAC